MKKALIYAKGNYLQTSVKKTSPVLRLVRGKNVGVAKTILKFHPTKSSKMVLKVLNSAAANAFTGLNLSDVDLYVHEIFVDNGPSRKKVRAGSRLRTRPRLKRMSHIVVGLSEQAKK